MIHAEISIYPIGTGSTSISFYIARAVEALDGIQGIRHHVTAMGTILESDRMEKISEAMQEMAGAVHSLGIARVELVLKVDSRRDKQARCEEKTDSVKKHLESFKRPK